MQINVDEVTPIGNPFIGLKFWVCDYRTGTDGSVISMLQPQLVELVVEQAQSNHRAYTRFKVVGSEEIIQLFHHFDGVPISIFNGEIECREFYKSLCLGQLHKQFKDLSHLKDLGTGLANLPGVIDYN